MPKLTAKKYIPMNFTIEIPRCYLQSIKNYCLVNNIKISQFIDETLLKYKKTKLNWSFECEKKYKELRKEVTTIKVVINKLHYNRHFRLHNISIPKLIFYECYKRKFETRDFLNDLEIEDMKRSLSVSLPLSIYQDISCYLIRQNIKFSEYFKLRSDLFLRNKITIEDFSNKYDSTEKRKQFTIMFDVYDSQEFKQVLKEHKLCISRFIAYDFYSNIIY